MLNILKQYGNRRVLTPILKNKNLHENDEQLHLSKIENIT